MRRDGTNLEDRIERFKAAAKEAGIKLTHQRLEIFKEVAGSLAHPDADAVFKGVRRRMPTVSLDTVYRTLWLLNDLELITTVGPRRESVRFDANLEDHHHYACVKCGLTTDFESGEFGALSVPEAVRKLGSVSGTHVEVRGVCESCLKRARKASRPESPGRTGGKRAKGALYE